MNKNNPWRYSPIAISLHWLIALLVIGLISMGWYMTSIEHDPNSGWYFDLHKSFGLLTGALILVRIVWRLTHKPAPLPASVPNWQVIISQSIHGLLYLCLILMPLTGFLGAAFGPYGVAFFGLSLPDWAPHIKSVSHPLFSLHGILAWTLVSLISLHILAAIKHALINKDGVIKRMWF